MIISDRNTLLVLKLTNPEDFRFAQSYEHGDTYHYFEGFMRDEGQIESCDGEPYGDDCYFMLHFTYLPGISYGFREEDTDLIDTHPWVAMISGDFTTYGVFLRFKTYADYCKWQDAPVFDQAMFYLI